ncbi:MAG: Jag N-terminal domain-containing protein [Thermoanaerobaculia bacterium]|nr:Jag N-terminal domain-containing protein [Thermoanaerobaculia bacterium]
MSERFEGKSLDEALQTAASALGAERHQLTYHVVLEKRGFLGGTKHVVIEAEVNEAALAPAAAATPQQDVHQPQTRPRASAPPRAERAGGGSGGRQARGGRGGRDGGERESRGGRGRGGRGRGPRREEEISDDGPPIEVPPQGEESQGAAEVRAWTERLIELSKLSLVVRSEENEKQIILRAYGRDSSLLTDRHGELLDAIQVLANKALTGRKIEKDIELDCEAFKERRVEALHEKARTLADLVRQDKREQLLPAMTPIERRIIHLALQDDADVTTESRGDGFYKRIAIVLRPAAESSTPEP